MDSVEFGRTAVDYARHRAGFPARIFEWFVAEGLVARDRRCLDLGSGTGSLARGLARLGARVTALDPSPELLEEATRLARTEGCEITLCEATAEETGLPPSSFELITAGQCWHWFDVVPATRELRRLLADGGCVALAAYDWLPLPDSLPAATEALIAKHNPTWTLGGGDGRHPEWRRDLEANGFEVVAERYEEIPVTYTPEAWRGRIRASAGIGASLSPERVARFDAEHAEQIAREFPGSPLHVPHALSMSLFRRRDAGEETA